MKHIALLIPIAAWALSACDTIDSNERWGEKAPVVIKKNVLIEDFTGQNCINCPTAANVIHQLQQGTAGAIIAVGIHGGSLSYSVDKTPFGLATAIGETYNTDWGVPSWPNGMIDRHGGLLEFTAWASVAAHRLGLDPAVEMELSTSYDGNASDTQWGKAEITVKLSEIQAGALKNAYINLWITESNITARQAMPDGTTNKEYVHQHVLRDVITPAYGQLVETTDDGTAVYTATYDIPKTYGRSSKTDVQHMAVVAFVTKGEKGEVMQTEEAHIAPAIETESE